MRKPRLGGTEADSRRLARTDRGAECVLAEGRRSRATCSGAPSSPEPSRRAPLARGARGARPRTPGAAPRPPSRSEPAAPSSASGSPRSAAGLPGAVAGLCGSQRAARAGPVTACDAGRHVATATAATPRGPRRDHQPLTARPRPHLRPSLRLLLHPKSSSSRAPARPPGPPRVEQHSPHSCVPISRGATSAASPP